MHPPPGSDVVEWLFHHIEGFQDRREARKYASNLLKAGFIRHTVNKITFSEQCYYVFGDLSDCENCECLKNVDIKDWFGSVCMNVTLNHICTHAFVSTLVVAGVKHVTLRLWKDFFNGLSTLHSRVCRELSITSRTKHQTVHKLPYEHKDACCRSLKNNLCLRLFLSACLACSTKNNWPSISTIHLLPLICCSDMANLSLNDNDGSSGASDQDTLAPLPLPGASPWPMMHTFPYQPYPTHAFSSQPPPYHELSSYSYAPGSTGSQHSEGESDISSYW